MKQISVRVPDDDQVALERASLAERIPQSFIIRRGLRAELDKIAFGITDTPAAVAPIRATQPEDPKQ